MKTATARDGFSLMEVNMAVFVMAIGILSMVALYPLGLRESTQGQADLKQSMFADYVLNQVVAIAAQTNVTWNQWSQIPRLQGQTVPNLSDRFPGWISTRMTMAAYPKMKKDVHYKVACCIVPGASDKIMGVMVQSTDLIESVTDFDQVTNNPIYYAEVMFQGVP